MCQIDNGGQMESVLIHAVPKVLIGWYNYRTLPIQFNSTRLKSIKLNSIQSSSTYKLNRIQRTTISLGIGVLLFAKVKSHAWITQIWLRVDLGCSQQNFLVTEPSYESWHTHQQVWTWSTLSYNVLHVLSVLIWCYKYRAVPIQCKSSQLKPIQFKFKSTQLNKKRRNSFIRDAPSGAFGQKGLP